MIDLHCHLLPGIDDGAPDETTALDMARIAVADGIAMTACTPHIYPGLYENDTMGIRRRVGALQEKLDAAGIALRLTSGADAHLTPELLDRLKARSAPTLNGGRYFLLEPPHHVAPPRFEDAVFDFVVNGYVPVITHPERLTWIAGHYATFVRLAQQGAWLQVTAGSLTGRFGRQARYWGEKLVDEGLVHILATDAHTTGRRAPRLAEGRDAAARFVGEVESLRLVHERPRAILDDIAPGKVVPIPAVVAGGHRPRRRGLLRRLLGAR